MIIAVNKAVGVGNTPLSAFDNALYETGVANCNLIRLSSVIPVGSKVEVREPYLPKTLWGDKLYVVYAAQYATAIGEGAYAGIGWAMDSEGNGLFVEHEGTSEDYVKASITQSLTDLFETRGMDMGRINYTVAGGQCEGKPICAFVVAVFESESWQNESF